MDSYFKAAVCDLDKLLDDFEQNTEEAENTTFASSVSQDSSLYHNHCSGSRCFIPEPPSISQTLPDVNALHYGLSAPVCPNDQMGQDPKGTALTGVDLLSSVDSRASKNVTPPCPDRSLKPVCDLVNDTGPPNLPWTNSHDAVREIEVAEKQLDEVLLVDFDSPAVSFPAGGHFDGSSACLSLLDVILPAAVERTAELEMFSNDLQSLESHEEKPQSIHPEVSDSTELCSNSIPDSPVSQSVTEDCVSGDVRPSLGEDVEHSEEDESEERNRSSAVPPDEGETSLSCLPMAVSMCSSFVASLDSQTATTEDGESRTCDSESCAVPSEGSEEAEPFLCLAQANSSPESDTKPVQTMSNPAVLPGCSSPVSERLSSRDLPESSQGPSYAVSQDYPVEFDLTSDYLPESEQSMMMVTDEELDAYLMGQAERSFSEKPVDDGFCEFNVDLDGELRSCPVDSFASPESDRSFRFLEESEGSNISSSSQDSSPLNPDAAQTGTIGDAPGPTETQAACGSNPPPYYGGARPKQLSSQAATALLPQQEQNSVQSEDVSSSEEESASPVTPVMSQAPSDGHYDDLYGHEELSEPPPYPGDISDQGASSGSRSGPEDGGLGTSQPAWVPDSEAPNCMKCGQKFTFTKRRHHCRACGKVYCAICCNRKCRLKYLDKEARVCVICYDTIHRAQALERMMSPTGPSPNPNVPSEYCSTIPPMQQARAAGTLNSPPPTVMVPVSVLKHPTNDGFPKEQKHVWFADGILPNGEVADTTKLSVKPRRSSQESSPVTPDPPTAHLCGKLPEAIEGFPGNPESGTEVPRKVPSSPWDYALLSGLGGCVERAPSLIPEDDEGLPPLLITTGEEDGGADMLVEERPAVCQIVLLLEEGGPRPLSFVLNANLLVNVRLASYCGHKCWCFSSNGLQGVGQRELLFVVERLPEENGLPRDIFSLYANIYQDAQKGKYIEELGNLTLSDRFLGSKDHGGFLFFSLSFQPLEELALPHSSFLCGLLIQKLEVPWAKVFPLRLLLSIGAEYNVYPCPLFSIRFRESVFKETGHTIMNLLADLRNYQYTVPVVDGLRIHMEVGNSYIDIPKSKLNEVLKVVNSSNEHVISIGACFSTDADSHLICVQNEDGSYQTQAKSTQGKTRRVTGASFVVFNGALKASSGFIAKSSIVEDGLMVQIPPETMDALRQALRDQTDFQITCGKAETAPEDRENVNVRWVDWTPPINKGITSPLDGKSLEGVPCVRVHQDSEFEMDGRSIRCTEVFYLLKAPDSSLSVIPSCSQFQREMATAVCAALCPHLSILVSGGINHLALRVSTDADMVEYQAGSGGSLLPQKYLNELDGALIPVIHGGSSSVPHQAMDMELFFYITQTI